MRRISRWATYAKRHASQPWFLAVGAVLTAIDVFCIVIPAEVLMVASVLARRSKGRRAWIRTPLVFASASAVGALALAAVVARWGPAALHAIGIGDDLLDSRVHALASGWMRDWGGPAVALSGIGVVPLTVGVIAAALAGVDPWTIAAWTLIGRLIKHFAMCWVALQGARWALRDVAVEGDEKSGAPDSRGL